MNAMNGKVKMQVQMMEKVKPPTPRTSYGDSWLPFTGTRFVFPDWKVSNGPISAVEIKRRKGIPGF